jgi:hypothetical protein
MVSRMRRGEMFVNAAIAGFGEEDFKRDHRDAP